MKNRFSPQKIFRSSIFSQIRRNLTISNDYKKVIDDFTSRKTGKNVMLVRHGESFGSLQKELYGITDYELTEKGIQEAEFLS